MALEVKDGFVWIEVSPNQRLRARAFVRAEVALSQPSVFLSRFHNLCMHKRQISWISNNLFFLFLLAVWWVHAVQQGDRTREVLFLVGCLKTLSVYPNHLCSLIQGWQYTHFPAIFKDDPLRWVLMKGRVWRGGGGICRLCLGGGTWTDDVKMPVISRQRLTSVMTSVVLENLYTPVEIKQAPSSS